MDFQLPELKIVLELYCFVYLGWSLLSIFHLGTHCKKLLLTRLELLTSSVGSMASKSGLA